MGSRWAGYITVQDAYSWDTGAYLDGVGEAAIASVEAPLWTETMRTFAEAEFMIFPRLLAMAEPRLVASGRQMVGGIPAPPAHHGPRLAALGVNFHRTPEIDWPEIEQPPMPHPNHQHPDASGDGGPPPGDAGGGAGLPGHHRQPPARDRLHVGTGERPPRGGPGHAGNRPRFLDRFGATWPASNGPRVWGFVTGGTTPAALAGDWLAAAFDLNLSSAANSYAPEVESEAVRMMRDLLSLPPTFHGTFVSGATLSNFAGLARAASGSHAVTGRVSRRTACTLSRHSRC